MNAVRDDWNPKFVNFSPVRSGVLTVENVTDAVDRAIAALCAEAPKKDAGATVEILNPMIKTGSMRVDLWVEEIDDTSCTYGFLCSSEDGCMPYARGERTCAKLGPRAQKTSARLLRDFQAFA